MPTAKSPFSSAAEHGALGHLIRRQNAHEEVADALQTCDSLPYGAGGLMAYGPNRSKLWRRAATFVAKILRGTGPAELPAEQSTRFDLVINLDGAKALGLAIPQSFLQRADQVIE